MLEIGKCNEVFNPEHGGLSDTLTAKSRNDFFMAKKNMLLWYNQYVKTGAPRLIIFIDVEIVPDPRKYAKLQQANAFSMGNSCKGTDSCAWISNQQPKHCQMQCVPGMSYTE